jgi:acyl dehydratase
METRKVLMTNQPEGIVAENAAQLVIVGNRIRPFATSITRERQAAYHEAAEIGASLYGDRVDASLLAIDAMRSISYTNQTDQDGLHAGHRVMQIGPIHHGEQLSLEGTVINARAMRQGTLITIAIDVRRASGEVPVKLEFRSLRLDAQIGRQQRPEPPTGSVQGYTLLTEKVLNPARVAAYSYEFPDAWVHFSPTRVAQLGLRAPLAHGAMSLTWIAGEIARQGAIEAMDLSVTFRHPIFWDERLRVYRNHDNQYSVVDSLGVHCCVGQLGMVRYADRAGGQDGSG